MFEQLSLFPTVVRYDYPELVDSPPVAEADLDDELDETLDDSPSTLKELNTAELKEANIVQAYNAAMHTPVGAFSGATRKRLRPKHLAIVSMHIAGLTNVQIAKALRINRVTVKQILDDPRAKLIRDAIMKKNLLQQTHDVQSYISANTFEAAKTVVTLMQTASSERVRQTSAFDILDRGGFKPVERVMNTNVNIDKEGALEISQALRESREAEPELDFVADSAKILAEIKQ